MAITLLNHNIRPYADLEAMLSTSHKAMVVAATGAGKTSVAVKYLEDHNLHALVVCPRVSVCQQWDATTDQHHYHVAPHGLTKYLHAAVG